MCVCVQVKAGLSEPVMPWPDQVLKDEYIYSNKTALLVSYSNKTVFRMHMRDD